MSTGCFDLHGIMDDYVFLCTFTNVLFQYNELLKQLSIL